MKMQIRRVFAAALEFNAGRICPEQLKVIAQKAEWKSRRLMQPSFISAQGLNNNSSRSLFTRHPATLDGSIGKGLLAEKERPWMVNHKSLRLSSDFDKKEATRKTRLDDIIRHVFEKLKPEAAASLRLETDVEFIHGGVQSKRKEYSIYGVPYYTLWYGSEQDLGIYLIIVHTNKPAFFESSEIHTYMGMVHAARRRRGEWNCRVYGLAANSQDFWFYHVDNGGEVRISSHVNHTRSRSNPFSGRTSTWKLPKIVPWGIAAV
ncbi:hypothetical protein N7470_002203 [Penicillium chermesinum]|nr:hypothetical protein N7470_002203 [Penicillium chermesinum]